MRSLVLLFIGSVLLATASFACGVMVGKRDIVPIRAGPSTETPIKLDWIEQDLMGFEFVQDALSRWAGKNQTTRAVIVADQATQAVILQDRVCTQFVPRTARLGGAPPVYCYKLDAKGWPTTELIYARDDLGE
jgi:hypothetical protein